MLEGKSMPSNMAANTNHIFTLLKNQSAIKINISIKCFSPQILGVRKFLCALSIFGIRKIPTHHLKEALVTWLLSASGLFAHMFKGKRKSGAPTSLKKNEY